MRIPGHKPCLALAAGLLTAACSGGGSADEMVSPDFPILSQRDALTTGELTGLEMPPGGPVLNAFYMPIGNHQTARHRLSGTLTVPEIRMSATTPDSNFGATGLRLFPGFSVAFVSSGDYLIPAERNIIQPAGGSSFWTLILSPGRVWHEPDDGDYSRASFPFALASNLSNETHNGVATFLFNNSEVSELHFQVVQETASWNRNDFWGQAPMSYQRGAIANEAFLVSDFADELNDRYSIRGFRELGFMNSDLAWSHFNRGLSYDDVSGAGFVVDGVIYMQPCATRYGDYPYCNEMRHGAFSVTKSMGGGLALMRLARKYGDNIRNLRISDYVDVSASHQGWQDVTFADALNMATGIGDNFPLPDVVQPFADENKPRMAAWSLVMSAEDKLAVAFSYGNYPWGPGQVFRYNTTHTFVLAAALDGFVKSMEGPDATLWQTVTNEVLRPIGIYHSPMMHTLEPNTDIGLPLLGIGFYPTVDDVAKIVTLLQNGGRHKGVQILDPLMVDEALMRTGAGLPTGEINRHGAHLYHLSFWSLPYRATGGCFRQIPYMEGYGGNFVMLLPNGAAGFRFADADIYDVEPISELGEAIAGYCN